MTTAIKDSLSNLNNVLQKLEMSASDLQDNMKAKSKQSSNGDLFSAPQKPQADVDAKAIASRLDGAIAKVEKLLREG